MLIKKERRSLPRHSFAEPVLGLVHHGPGSGRGKKSPYPFFAGILDSSANGLMIETDDQLATGTRITLCLYDEARARWHNHLTEVVWAHADNRPSMAGLKFLVREVKDRQAGSECVGPPEALLADIEFLLDTELLQAIPESAIWSLLNCLTLKKVRKGTRLIKQNAAGNCLYIIQQGTCAVLVEKNGLSHPVAKLGPGEVVGEMAVLTGEKRHASVDAFSDLRLWRLGRKEFEAMAKAHPDLRVFLTELVTRRLETSCQIADRTIGKYLIKNKLGVGGWAIVYLAEHMALNMPVAIKMLKHQKSMAPLFRKKFISEARTIAQLHHRNIVHIHDIEVAYRTIFIIMEYLEGQALNALIEQHGALPFARAAGILAQVCAGLAYAHGEGVIHQDIKPDNLIIQDKNRTKILDFGLACSPGCTDLNMLGTVQYAAPEQINGGVIDQRTDIYCLGLTAYEMVTGRLPYPDDDLVELLTMHLEKDIPDPIETVPDLPEELRRFILKACRRKPEDRYQNIEAALAELTPLCQRLAAGNESAAQDQSMASLFLFYTAEHHRTLNRLLEEFSLKAEQAGITIKAAEFKEV